MLLGVDSSSICHHIQYFIYFKPDTAAVSGIVSIKFHKKSCIHFEVHVSVHVIQNVLSTVGPSSVRAY